MTTVSLRIAEPTGRYRRSLRRYVPSADRDCPAGGYHNASADIGDVDEAERAEASGDNWPHDDPRWPKACECGYEFTPDDRWQRNDSGIYQMPSGAAEFTFRGSFGRCAPPGAMIRATWYDDYADQPGESWIIALPDGGEWITTQNASGGGHWEVTGTPPHITVTPSIWHHAPHGWHGWIRAGVLVPA